MLSSVFKSSPRGNVIFFRTTTFDGPLYKRLNNNFAEANLGQRHDVKQGQRLFEIPIHTGYRYAGLALARF